MKPKTYALPKSGLPLRSKNSRFFLICWLGWWSAAEVHAESFDVLCSESELIFAIESANGNGEADILNLEEGCAYDLSGFPPAVPAGSFQQDPAATALPVVESEITIVGNGAVLDIAQGPFRHFYIGSDGHLILEGVTLTGGNPEGHGGAIYSSAGGDLTVMRSTIAFNVARGHSSFLPITSGQGGGIYKLAGGGTLDILNSTISGNSATILDSPIFENTLLNGGALYVNLNFGLDRLTIENSTITGNNGNILDNSNFGVGGIAVVLGSDLDEPGQFDDFGGISNSIVSGNIGSLSNRTVFARDCGLAVGNTENDQRSTFDSAFSIYGSDAACSSSGDQTGIDLRLGPLDDNGGPSPTHALTGVFSSPAIDRGSCPFESVDQRGRPRPRDGDLDNLAECDVGAYELTAPNISEGGLVLLPVVNGQPAATVLSAEDPPVTEFFWSVSSQSDTGTASVSDGSLPGSQVVGFAPGGNFDGFGSFSVALTDDEPVTGFDVITVVPTELDNADPIVQAFAEVQPVVEGGNEYAVRVEYADAFGLDRSSLGPDDLAVVGDNNAVLDALSVDLLEPVLEQFDSPSRNNVSDSISADGRFVVFETLVGGAAPVSLIRLHDRLTGEVSTLSAGLNGQPANGDSRDPSISGDGRFVAFESAASNLVEGDSNGVVDGFVYDRLTDVIERVSVNSAEEQAVGGRSFNIGLSDDGQTVTFLSSAVNLAPGVANGTTHVFVRFRQTGITERVSVNTDGTQANASSANPAISGNGLFIVFVSPATNLSPDDAGGVFVRELFARSTEKVDTFPSEISDLGEPDISENGRFVVYDEGAGGGVYLVDRVESTRTLVNAQSDSDSGARTPTISGDGRYVAYESFAPDLIDDDTNGSSDVFLFDAQTGTTERLSLNSAGGQGNGDSFNPSLSKDLRFVSFYSEADNLVDNDSNGVSDVFVRDRQTGNTERVSAVDDNTSPLTAIYTFTPPGGGWDDADRGEYAVRVNPGEILDTSGNGISGSEIFRFTVGFNTPPEITETEPLLRLSDGNSITLNAIDADGDPLIWSVAEQPSGGRVELANANGDSQTFTYLPNRESFISPDSFLVRVADGRGGVDAVRVDFIDDESPAAALLAPPQVTSGAEDATFTIGFSDFVRIDAESIQFNVGESAGGSITVTSPGGRRLLIASDGGEFSGPTLFRAGYTYPAPGGVWGPEDNGVYVVSVDADQGILDLAGNRVPAGEIGRFTVGLNSPPEISDLTIPPLPRRITVDVRSIEIALSATDRDGDASLLRWSLQPEIGVDPAASIQTSGGAQAELLDLSGGTTTVRYSQRQPLDITSPLSDGFIARVADGAGGVDTMEIDVRISPLSGVTIVQGARLAVSTLQNQEVFVTLNARAASDRSLRWQIVSSPSRGEASVSDDPRGRDQRVRYMPEQDFLGSDRFTVRVADQNGDSAEIVIDVRVRAAGEDRLFSDSFEQTR